MPIADFLKRSRPLFLLATLVASADLSAAEPLSAEARAAIETATRDFMSQKQIPGLSIAVAIDNEIVYAAGFGLADVENAVPVSADTLFRTASIAKPLTAVAALRLASQGKLDLDAPVQTYFPDFPEKRWPITTRQLLSHLAGVRHYRGRDESSSPRHYPTVAAGLAVFANDPLLHEPGSKYLYSSFGFNLAGAVAEKAGDASFEDLLRREVLDPAGMSATRVDDHYEIIPHRARGYAIVTITDLLTFADDDLKIGDLVNAPLHDTSMKVPGGGLLATSSDLLRFVIALNRGSLLDEPTRAAMWTTQKTTDGTPTNYGLGWQIRERNGRKLVGHGGGQAGTATHLLADPARGVTVAALCNLEGASPEPLTSAIVQQLTASAAENTPQAARPAAIEPAEGYGDIAAELTAFIDAELPRKAIPALSIALVDGDRIVWARGFGTAKAEGNKPATAGTVYRVGSISKLLTDVAVTRLTAAGTLSLDEDIRKYLPDFAPLDPEHRPITLRQLMSHRAGLVRESPVGSYFDPTEPTLAATVASLNGLPLVYAPGTKTKYSNAGVAVAGYVLERATDTPFDRYMRESLLAPLGMTDSGYLRPAADHPDVAEGWMWGHDGQRFVAPDFALGTLPAGNLYSSVTDLGRFVVAVMNEGQLDGKQVIEASVLEEMLKPAAPQDGPRTFGIGFALSQFEGETAFGHGGAVYGFATQVKGLPARKLGVVAVTNLDCANGFTGRVTDHALKLMLARKDGKTVDPLPTAADVDPAEARKLQGRFAAGDDLLDLIEYRGRLYVRNKYTLRELRKHDAEFVLDDIFGYGPSLKIVSNDELTYSDETWARQPDLPPAAPPDRWKGLIGTYGWKHNPLYILEDGGKLWALIEWFHFYPLTEISENEFAFPDAGLYPGEKLIFQRNDKGVATRVVAASVAFERMPLSDLGETFKITPLRVPAELKEMALKSSPPPEAGPFRKPELVDLTTLDPTIKFDIRYATENNFVGSRFYDEPKAFLQKPAAEALLRAHQKAKDYGLGLLIHDAYRPWYVTKMFWDATPADLHDFVADPSKGSRHNRGCAVDLTFYDLATGRPVEAAAGYDEFSTRSYPEFPGGTGRQRWHRNLLRRLMEAEGFSIYEFEWWHFDYADWRKYPILNLTFDKIPPA